MTTTANINKESAIEEMLNLLDKFGNCWAEFDNNVSYLTYQKVGDNIIARKFDQYTNVVAAVKMSVESFKRHINNSPIIKGIGYNK